MDIDPPAPPSSTPKKPKFAPKRPTRRKTAPVLPKCDSSDDDAETKRKLLRKVNEHLGSRRPKKEKKSASDNVKPSQGTGSSKTHDQPKCENSNKSPNLSSENNLTLSSSVATKDEDIDKMMVDDQSDSSSDTEYKEPWDPNSYYPITLPLRPFGSGNPEVLDEKEFGEEMEHDETKMNSALELGLLGQENNEEKKMMLFQFPEKLPLDKLSNQATVSVKGKDKVESSGSSKVDVSNKGSGLKDLPNGHMGKMLVYKSGAVKLKLGDIIYNVTPGILDECQQDVAVMNTESKHCCVLGPVDKKAIVTPDVDSMLDSINQL
ncbi:uncharacterized protein [Rutidosis leptorrhynchoides]|uniref:uncharacterized protein n=1 Tax=Rutidosis leptorrhynchoides TaxID=125765 RepID=UPI003A9952BC